MITRKLIDYCRRDVLATTELCERMLIEYERHPIGLPPTLARSPAALAKAYLDAMGIRPPLEQNPHFPRERLGQAMSAYFGGRTECRIRRWPVPVLLVDFLSMYPTVNALLGLSRFLVAERIEVVDATKEVRRFLDEVTVEDLFRPETWRQLTAFCLVEANGAVLPARAGYQSGNWQIGVNPLTSRKELWYSLADLVGAKLLGEGAPELIEAWRPEPVGLQKGLRPVRLRGEVEIDPRRDDIFRRVIEERKRLAQRTTSTHERELLDETLKVIANSGSYGINAEMTRLELGAARRGHGLVARRAVQRKSRTRSRCPAATASRRWPHHHRRSATDARAARALRRRARRQATPSATPIRSRSSRPPRGGLIPCPGGDQRLGDGRPAAAR